MVRKQIEAARPYKASRDRGEFTELELEAKKKAEDNVQQSVEVYSTEHRQYWAPFNYPNFCVKLGRSDIAGPEYNMDGVEIDIPPWGAITFEEVNPILEVTVIGSACSPPGTVILHAEPMEWKFARTGVKMKAENLWGEHINAGPWFKGVHDDWREAGLSSCTFALPECKKVTLMGWSQQDMGRSELEQQTNDGHYCFRIVRVTVKV